jgi:hypothetical protein
MTMADSPSIAAMESTAAFLSLLAVPEVLAPPACAARPLRVGVGMQIVTPDPRVHAPVYIAGYGDNRAAPVGAPRHRRDRNLV